MNALEARRAIRRKAGIPDERPKSEEMAEWLDREWDRLEAARSALDPSRPEDARRLNEWAAEEDAWLENLRKYERRCNREAGR